MTADMSNDHVPEPFRSLLNDLTRSHRAAHEELREGMAAINRVNRQTMSEPKDTAVKIVIERSPRPENAEPQYLWTAYYEGQEDELSESGYTPQDALANFLAALEETP